MTRTLNLIAFVVFASALFIRSTDPVIPLIADGLRVEPATAALLSTAFTLPYALMQPVLGALADMFSKARLMLLCMVIVTVATLLCALGAELRSSCGRRASSPGSPPAAWCRSPSRWSATRFRSRERQVAMGRLLFAIMTGNLLGATCAGVVGDLVGWRGVFFVTGVFGAIALAVAVPGFRGAERSARGRFDLSNLIAELPRDLPQSAGENLFRRGVSRSAVHVRLLSLHRTMLHAGRRDPRLDRRHRDRRLRHRRRALRR